MAAEWRCAPCRIDAVVNRSCWRRVLTASSSARWARPGALRDARVEATEDTVIVTVGGLVDFSLL
jgi:hypothetical protein